MLSTPEQASESSRLLRGSVNRTYQSDMVHPRPLREKERNERMGRCCGRIPDVVCVSVVCVCV